MRKIHLARHISWQKIPNENTIFVYNIVSKKYYIFKDTEFLIWDFIYKNEYENSENIVEVCASYYEIAKDIIRNDILEFLDDLFQIGVISYE